MSHTEQVIIDYVLEEILSADDHSTLDVELPLLKNGIIDSMDLQRMVLYLEDRFGVVVADDELIANNFETARSIAAMVERLRGDG